MINEKNTEGKKYGLEINCNKSTFIASRLQTIYVMLFGAQTWILTKKTI